jgi:hypothetical protein
MQDKARGLGRQAFTLQGVARHVIQAMYLFAICLPQHARTDSFTSSNASICKANNAFESRP